MGKGKPREYPEKIQNKLGNVCDYLEIDEYGNKRCEIGYGKIDICKGNRHNCNKVKYTIFASKK